MSEPNARARILVWSDYVCPYCYLIERDLDRLREQYADKLIIDYRAFELRPDPKTVAHGKAMTTGQNR